MCGFILEPLNLEPAVVEMSNKKYLIFGACNPMIDITARVDADFLAKYNLLPNDAIIGTEANLNIYEEMKSKYADEIEFTSGGSGFNTMKTASWILQMANSTVFMGCVGQDKYAEIIRDEARQIGVKGLFQTHPEAASARCAVLLTGNNRSLVCHLGAAALFTADHIDKNWPAIEGSRLYYLTGFFLLVCPEGTSRIAKFAFENDRPFCFNISALYISQFFKKELTQILPYVDILFGNEEEMTAFAKNVLNIQCTDMFKLASLISTCRKVNKKRKRLVIITRAEKPVIYACENQIYEIDVPAIEAEKIVDTSCAGDAFVGGFLAQYVLGESIENCIGCGIWASGMIIQRVGCTFPNKMDYQAAIH